MGWYKEQHPGHEGYVVGLKKTPGGWRWVELHEAGDAERHEQIEMIQVACECGWRSPRYYAPIGTRWSPCIVIFDDKHGDFEEAAARLWDAHVQEEARAATDRGLPNVTDSFYAAVSAVRDERHEREDAAASKAFHERFMKLPAGEH